MISRDKDMRRRMYFRHRGSDCANAVRHGHCHHSVDGNWQHRRINKDNKKYEKILMIS